ncbi:DUF4190 domain-containing protein [Nocardioides plantarum]|uniref:DUF4190 domain-containing protein n=1 Tax=Nocardioides plantarum TaxID=29299 RepID=A0ABV5KAM5_9ACTN|nr:DUF4190 domain-containing protein [Nocardioides plantarum]
MTQQPGTPDETPDSLAEPASPSGEQAPAYGEASSPYVSPPAAPAGYTPYAPTAQGHPFAQPHAGAIAALVLGIVSVVSSLLIQVTCFSIVGSLTGPFAIALGARARKEIEQDPGRYTNPGIATAAFVTGLIGSAIALAVVGVGIVLLGLFISVAGP